MTDALECPRRTARTVGLIRAAGMGGRFQRGTEMRLTCPNCGAEYDAPDGMIPTEGRHVQCSACHTRWFAHGVTRTAPSEDQILQRLEARAPRLRAVPDADARSGPEDAPPPEDPDRAFDWEDPDPAPGKGGLPDATAPEAGASHAPDGPEPGDSAGAERSERPEIPAVPISWPTAPGVPQPRSVPQAPVAPISDAGKPAQSGPGGSGRLDLTPDGPDGPDVPATGTEPGPARHWALVLLALAILAGLGYLMFAGGSATG